MMAVEGFLQDIILWNSVSLDLQMQVKWAQRRPYHFQFGSHIFSHGIRLSLGNVAGQWRLVELLLVRLNLPGRTQRTVEDF